MRFGPAWDMRLTKLMRLGSHLIAVVAAGTAALAVLAPADASAAPLLCGILKPIDRLLHCAEPDSQPSAPQQSPEPVSTAAPAAASPSPRPKLAPTAPRAVPGSPEYVANLLVLRFRPGTSAQARANALAAAGASVARRIRELGAVVVEIRPERREQALAELLRSPAIASAERDGIVRALETTPNDPSWPDQWGLQRIGLTRAWDRTRGAHVTVAVLDSGVDAGHPDLQGAVLPAIDLTQTGTDDVYGHGTAVAGVIGARANNHLGGAGLCWDCSLLPIKVLDNAGRGSMDVVAEGIVKAADLGVRVISMSLGGPASSATLDQAIDYATAKNAVLVASAGNNGVTTPFYPAASPNVVGVAATDETDRLYPWSNSGTWVRIAAPGCNPAPRRGGGYELFCGTSSAAPIVSGLVALALSLRPDARADQIVEALTSGADPLTAVQQGLVDADRALSTVAPGTALQPSRPQALTTRVRAALTPGRHWQAYRRLLEAGTATATLAFPKGAWLTLSLISSSNTVLATVSGHTPLRLARNPGRGVYWYGVASSKPAALRFTLTVVAQP
jgi:subtilisin family serine protease